MRDLEGRPLAGVTGSWTPLDVFDSGRSCQASTPPGGDTITTQIFFPGNVRNDSDPNFDRSLVVRMSPDGNAGRIDFVIPGS